jgi:signal transduction histidine kinase
MVNIIPLGFSVYQAKRFFRMHKHLDQLVFQRTRDLENAMKNLRQSHENLKAAQNQLIQQEKLASLGQLTAGIAHEIKNPLNFVTNFSDVCLELIEEAKTEIGKQKKTLIKVQPEDIGESRFLENLDDLLQTVELNLKKVFQHGTRADGIVKSMLLHSRGGSGKIESINLNHLMKEYVNLAYHGMRASPHPFDVEIRFDLDTEIKKVPLIAEDFSRVILNLCNNAFDAMRERTTEKGYKAVLQISTQKCNGLVKVSVKDNGPGISPDILNSILQPFFTTKKGTEGTGLGLSLSNEIVKAHGGEIEVNSVPGNGAEFNIKLPLRKED